MPELLQAGVEVPQSTGAQEALALFVTALAVIVALGLWFRFRQFGLREHKPTREEAHEQYRSQTPAELKVRLARAADLDLYARIDALFDADPRDTRTGLPGAALTIYEALAVAWSDRVASIPRLARWPLLLAGPVAVFGSVAVSSGLVVELLRAEPSGGTSPIALISGGIEWAIAGLGQFPYLGVFWQLGIIGTLQGGQWLFERWLLVVVVLVIGGAAVLLLDRRLDSETVPERIVRDWRAVALVGVGGLAAIWAVGTSIAVLGRAAPMAVRGVAVVPVLAAVVLALIAMLIPATRIQRGVQLIGVLCLGGAFAGEGWGDAVGFLLALALALFLAYEYGTVGYRRVRRAFTAVAGADVPAAAAFVLVQRALAVVSGGATVLLVAYAILSVTSGNWGPVIAAALTAAPAVQVVLGVAVIALFGGIAYLFAGSWPDVYTELRAAVAQQAVRAQLLRSGIPWVGVFFAYALLSVFIDILPALVGAVVFGLVLQQLIGLVDEAAYRADTPELLATLFRPSPTFLVVLTYQLDVDDTELFRVDVNGRAFVHTDRETAVEDAAAYADALVNHEDPPATDSEHIADFVFESGIVDPDDWEEKLDEMIRKAALNTIRGPHIPIIGKLLSPTDRARREAFDKALDEFEDERVDQRLHEPDLYRSLEVGEHQVRLVREVHGVEDETPWPTFGD